MIFYKTKQTRHRLIAVAVFLFMMIPCVLYAADGAATRRFGIFAGSNNGGRGRTLLRYAVSDAKSMSRIFTGMGGIAGEDNVILIEPTIAEINRHIDNFGRISAQSRQNAQRTELVFYYSGHSDEDGILLNRERYAYRELRDRINSVQSDMRIVILDSCSSGAITRAKGGTKTQPFLFDSSVSAEGYAFLTSSSADEVSQESDSIESSYFTHSLMSGLRGAADSVGDGRVTLNELYRFAYAETLAQTETSLFGTQHPSYDIQISGSGDVILTDIKEISASLIIGETLAGRFSIRDGSDFLLAELTKVGGKPIELGLEPGTYRIIWQRGNNFYRAEFVLGENSRISLSMEDFTMIAAASGGRSRGNDKDDVEDADVPVRQLNIQLIPGLDIFGRSGEKAVNNFLFGLLVGMGYNINGIGLASIGLTNTGYVNGLQVSSVYNIAGGWVRGLEVSGVFNIAGADVMGIQAAGVFNTASGDVQGIQASGVFNIAGADVMGVHAAGVFNMASGDVQGIQTAGIFNRAGSLNGVQAGIVNITGNGEGRSVQFGIVNISDSENTVPIGLVNIIRNGIFHPVIYTDDMMFLNAGLRSGSKHFYSRLDAGIGGGFIPKREEDRLFAGRAGFGIEIPISKFFIDIDISSGSIINIDSLRKYFRENNVPHNSDTSSSITGLHQLRISGGYKIAPHFGILAGVSYDYLYQHKGASPVPEGFGLQMPNITKGKHIHKLGFFGGMQF
ncbi:MAG: caspase family protein [Treponema sp.]|jgi:hypothetical protein|nr:caspase family protein [Treponema sp.]